MTILLRIGGIRFQVDSDTEILVEESFAPFFCTKKNVIDVNVHVFHNFSAAPLPSTAMIGEDLLVEYYRENERLLCLTKGGQGRYLACCTCDRDMRELTCYLNLEPGCPADSLGTLLRMIPIRRIMLSRGVLFFHASQIALGDTGILFTAPSQTGKTTQARLWHRHRNAQILCNDRTLTDGTYTYGFPVDGSEPVISGEIRKLGAIIVLEQAPVNEVRRLRVREILHHLMPQQIMDVWDPASRAAAVDLLLGLIPSVPVYLLRCTPDYGAVACLERQLKEDGVIINE